MSETPLTSLDYSAFEETVVPKNEVVASLMAMVADASKLEIEAAAKALELKAIQEKLRQVLTRDIPTLMADMNMKSFQNANGIKIDIKDEVHASISQENQPVAFAWLEANNHGGLIKREVSVAFNRDQQEAATALVTELRGKFAAVAEEKKVHPSTLKAWAKEQLEKGADIPAEPFGIFQQKIAKISVVKNKSKRA